MPSSQTNFPNCIDQPMSPKDPTTQKDWDLLILKVSKTPKFPNPARYSDSTPETELQTQKNRKVVSNGFSRPSQSNRRMLTDPIDRTPTQRQPRYAQRRHTNIPCPSNAVTSSSDHAHQKEVPLRSTSFARSNKTTPESNKAKAQPDMTPEAPRPETKSSNSPSKRRGNFASANGRARVGHVKVRRASLCRQDKVHEPQFGCLDVG